MAPWIGTVDFAGLGCFPLPRGHKAVAIRPPLKPHPRKPRGPLNGRSGHHYLFIRWYSRGVTAWRAYAPSIGYGLPHRKANHDQACYAAECERWNCETHRHQHRQQDDGYGVRPRCVLRGLDMR